jgi:hypothetical protein
MISDNSSGNLDTIDRMRIALRGNPEDTDLALRVWEMMGSGQYNIQNGIELVRLFRSPALSSDYGIKVFARLFRELMETSGEPPRADMFDGALLDVIRALASRDNDEDVDWLRRQTDTPNGQGIPGQNL